MTQKKDAELKSDSTNPIIALWEKIPSPVRLPIFAVLIIAALAFVKTGEETSPPKAVFAPETEKKAVQEETAAAPSGEAEEFTGAYIEWPEGEIEAYVTSYIKDNQVLVSLSNLTKEKKFFIDKINLVFRNEVGEEVDSGELALTKELNPGEKTGLFDFNTENKEGKTRADMNQNVRTVDMEMEMRIMKAASSSI